jgi:hypothetical protein
MESLVQSFLENVRLLGLTAALYYTLGPSDTLEMP